MPFLQSMPENAGPPTIFKLYPAIYDHWGPMSEAMMNGPSSLSQGERELILAYAAAVAGGSFVAAAHSEVAYAWGIADGAVDLLLENPATAPVDDKLKPLLALVKKLAVTPAQVAQADIDAVLAAGWDEQALHDAIAVTARAAFMQRLAQGFGFTPMTKEAAAARAQQRKELGYVNLYKTHSKL